MPVKSATSPRRRSPASGRLTDPGEQFSYRLKQVTGQRIDFAEVVVAVVPAAVRGVSPDRPAGSGEYPPMPEWVTAARRGAGRAIAVLSECGLLTRGPAVRIVRIVGSFSDTRSAAVQCAATIATWRALARGLPEPTVRLGRQLRLQYPTVNRHTLV